ncbi:MAG: helix-turn-helix transcriptional regulator [Streptococcaceae bacterium]|jgi:AraC-like DNA-binding protein|nr:helix-turn-helix transcriptional regulator [Streptococcaceae bacterium]
MAVNNLVKNVKELLLKENIPFFRFYNLRGEKIIEVIKCPFLKIISKAEKWESCLEYSSKTISLKNDSCKIDHFLDYNGLIYFQKRVYKQDEKIFTIIMGGFSLKEDIGDLEEKEEITTQIRMKPFIEIVSHVESIDKKINKLVNQLPEILQEIIILLKKDFKKNYTLDDIAKSFFIHKSTINRLFKKHTQKTYGQYYRELKLIFAMKCLEELNMTVEEVSMMVGYTSTSSLNRALRNFK